MLTKELSRKQQILAEITKELIINEEDLVGFGLQLDFTYGMIQQTRTNHSRSVEGAALHLACLWWEDEMFTEEEKVAILLEAVRAIGKIRLVGWVEEKLEGAFLNMVEGIEEVEGDAVNVAGGRDDQVEGGYVNVVGGIDQAEGSSVNVSGGTDQVEGASVNVSGGRDQVEGTSVNVAGRIDQVEGATVMTVDANNMVRKRFVGCQNQLMCRETRL